MVSCASVFRFMAIKFIREQLLLHSVIRMTSLTGRAVGKAQPKLTGGGTTRETCPPAAGTVRISKDWLVKTIRPSSSQVPLASSLAAASATSTGDPPATGTLKIFLPAVYATQRPSG